MIPPDAPEGETRRVVQQQRPQPAAHTQQQHHDTHSRK
jgi:hypothetical protein